MILTSTCTPSTAFLLAGWLDTVGRLGRPVARTSPPGRQLQARAPVLARPPSLGVNVKVILTPPCIFCMENH
jgi:hypothetical protein